MISIPDRTYTSKTSLYRVTSYIDAINVYINESDDDDRIDRSAILSYRSYYDIESLNDNMVIKDSSDDVTKFRSYREVVSAGRESNIAEVACAQIKRLFNRVVPALYDIEYLLLTQVSLDIDKGIDDTSYTISYELGHVKSIIIRLLGNASVTPHEGNQRQDRYARRINQYMRENMIFGKSDGSDVESKYYRCKFSISKGKHLVELSLQRSISSILMIRLLTSEAPNYLNPEDLEHMSNAAWNALLSWPIVINPSSNMDHIANPSQSSSIVVLLLVSQFGDEFNSALDKLAMDYRKTIVNESL